MEQKQGATTQKFLRCLQHIPVGVVNAAFLLMPLIYLSLFPTPILPTFVALLVIGSIAAILFFLGFIVGYEFNEDMHLKDGAWIDVAGWLWGFGLLLLIGSWWLL